MKNKSPISVSLVAKKAGVSPATVSRVLHGASGVSEAKRKRVQEVLDSLGQMPRMRGIDRKQSGARTVAILIIDPDGLHGSSIDLYRTILAAEKALRQRKIDVIFGVVDKEAIVPSAVLAGKVDGLLLAGVDYPARLKSLLGALPSLWLTSHHEGRGGFTLAGNEDIARMAAGYLLERGHKSLAYLQIPRSHPVHGTRGEFFEFTASSAGAVVQRYCAEPLRLEGGEDVDWGIMYADILEQVQLLKKSKPRPTGAFVPVGMFVGLLYRALAECGLRPGYDVEVICCEQNCPLVTSLCPRPACIQIDTQLVAECAIEELERLMSDPAARSRSVTVSVAPRLIPGD